MAAVSANPGCHDKAPNNALKEVLDALGITYTKSANKADLIAKIKASDHYTKAVAASTAQK